MTTTKFDSPKKRPVECVQNISPAQIDQRIAIWKCLIAFDTWNPAVERQLSAPWVAKTLRLSRCDGAAKCESNSCQSYCFLDPHH